VEPLEDFEASIFASPWNHCLSLNNQSINHRLQDQVEVNRWKILRPAYLTLLESPPLPEQSINQSPASGTSRSGTAGRF
jgi:hypothetical protein